MIITARKPGRFAGASMPGANVARWGFSTPGSSPSPPTPTDLISAIVSQLRSWNGGAIPAALAENVAVIGGTKIWVDEAMGSPALPWLRISEITEPMSPESLDGEGNRSFVASNAELQISIFAETKVQARTIRRTVIDALFDQDLTNDDAAVMYFMPSAHQFPITSEPGVGVPIQYHAIASFTYFLDRQYTP